RGHLHLRGFGKHGQFGTSLGWSAGRAHPRGDLRALDETVGALDPGDGRGAYGQLSGDLLACQPCELTQRPKAETEALTLGKERLAGRPTCHQPSLRRWLAVRVPGGAW